MDDNNILNLFWARDEAALDATKKKYGRGLQHVAFNILANSRDAEECLNDTLHRAWEVIPPKRPEYLGAYLSKITRNLSIKRWKAAGAEKRGGGQTDQMLSELEQAIPGGQSIDSQLDYSQTVQAINAYLRGMDATARIVFVRRYFFGDSIRDISRQFKSSESKTKSMLFRARQKLKSHLEKEGVVV